VAMRDILDYVILFAASVLCTLLVLHTLDEVMLRWLP